MPTYDKTTQPWRNSTAVKKEQFVRYIAAFISAVGLVAIGGVAYVCSGTFDIAASSPHSTFERWLLGTAMRRAVVAKAASVDEPPPFTDDMITDGFQHYDEMCTGCHGGPDIDRSEIGKGLNPQPPNLAAAVKAWTPRQLFWIVEHGVKMTGMPSFGMTHTDKEVWSIVAFIEKLAEMSPGQYQRMKQEAGAKTHGHMTH